MGLLGLLWGYWCFGCFCCAISKGFSFHFLAVVAFCVASFDWVSVVLSCVFKYVKGVVWFTSAMKQCSLCNCTLPPDTTKRRRLHGTSSSFALQTFVEISSQAHLGSLVPCGDKGVDGPFLCLPCHGQLEKISKLKANLKYLTGDVERKMKQL